MSVILEFPSAATRPRTWPERIAACGRPLEAEIIIFPGVRIERAGARQPAAGTLRLRPSGNAACARRPVDGAD